ncbi:hypothetical protein AB0C34_25060 [Nocardia sp. NPDC049220]|uniref:hypothetical protein n=1 Tax=Nocardia sp. NPDC049220 TaxID=3155273 RepID=UPI0033CBAAD1
MGEASNEPVDAGRHETLARGFLEPDQCGDPRPLRKLGDGGATTGLAGYHDKSAAVLRSKPRSANTRKGDLLNQSLPNRTTQYDRGCGLWSVVVAGDAVCVSVDREVSVSPVSPQRSMPPEGTIRSTSDHIDLQSLAGTT